LQFLQVTQNLAQKALPHDQAAPRASRAGASGRVRLRLKIATEIATEMHQHGVGQSNTMAADDRR
jgi:hypothetical protein